MYILWSFKWYILTSNIHFMHFLCQTTLKFFTEESLLKNSIILRLTLQSNKFGRTFNKLKIFFLIIFKFGRAVEPILMA